MATEQRLKVQLNTKTPTHKLASASCSELGMISLSSFI
ncbi:hypothetical protein BN341_14970 [Helicobacter heilmannii ASB1.4]|nr:hypothetical protein BN341_14920 [Helicobacter heilmannii ASB1.4]CCM73628.1 hypothetical protein BN341_14970 [Helicobacter heilmannii ASB1.4]